MVDRELLARTFAAGLEYPAYLATAKPAEKDNWAKLDAQVKLTAEQRALVGGFVRYMPVLVISGTWCGDCVAQCPMLARIAEAAPALARPLATGGKTPRAIDLRFVDRDAHAELAERVKICGGMRVPTAIFMNEDFEFVALLGDRTLTRYRAMAAKQLGAACPLPGAPVPAAELEATLADWVNEFERVQLLLRLSGKLRQRYGE